MSHWLGNLEILPFKALGESNYKLILMQLKDTNHVLIIQLIYSQDDRI